MLSSSWNSTFRIPVAMEDGDVDHRRCAVRTRLFAGGRGIRTRGPTANGTAVGTQPGYHRDVEPEPRTYRLAMPSRAFLSSGNEGSNPPPSSGGSAASLI